MKKKKEKLPYFPYFKNDYCPPECACYGRVVQCSDKGVDKVPYGIPYNTRYMLLMNNKIDLIQLDLLKEYLTMEFLVLSNNRLTDSAIEGAFEGIEKLTRLYLDKNLLSSIPTDLPPTLEELRLNLNNISVMSEQAWSRCKSLKIISINNNTLTNDSIPAGVFSSLTNLQTLSLNHNQLIGVPSKLPTNLKELFLEGNQIDTISAQIFTDYSELLYLDLSNNLLTNKGIDKNSFSHMVNLENLNLGLLKLCVFCEISIMNSTILLLLLATVAWAKPFRQTGFLDFMLEDEGSGKKEIDDKVDEESPPTERPDVPEGAVCPFGCQCHLRVIQCSDLGLKNVPADIPSDTSLLDLQNNKITEIREFDFKNLKILHLTNTKNVICRESTGAFKMSLLRLPLFAALLSGILCQYDYYYEPASLLGPSGPNCPEECECPISFPSAMYCDNRKLKYIPIVPSGIKYLYLQRNQIDSIKNGVFDNATELSWLILDENQIVNSNIGKKTFSKLKKLERLYMNNNKLTEPVGPLPNTLQELKLANNEISKFPSSLLKGLQNLTVIQLQENELQDDALAGVFQGLNSLTYLDLSTNKLKRMPQDLPSALEMLYADHNEISKLPVNYLQKLPKLQYLRISHNQLVDSGIPADFFNVTSLIELDLSFNKLQSIPVINENLENLYLQVNEINKFDLASFCKITGPLNYSRLKHLRLDGNNITRNDLPVDISNCLRQASEVIFE
ncbi:Lumican [Acipenser ruthenus]|uniref:Lumican n=2 Tax=Acipenser ruthenus TaxID=7906 RepID=A0A444TWM7_ACIRT|nr:Lumican [Acipenser ruthenus]